jgi:hypothetical protein
MATVTDPPSWLKRGTRASFEFKPFQRRAFTPLGAEAEILAKRS